MVSKKDSKFKNTPKAERSNLDIKKSNDFIQKSSFDRKPKLFENMPEEKYNMKFRRGLQESDIKCELWIIEGEDNFEELSVRAKLSRMAKCGDKAFKDWIISKATDNEIGDNWETIKSRIIDYCIGVGIETLYRYENEPWSCYCTRLKDACKSNGENENIALKYLRKMRLPDKLQLLIYGSDFSLQQIIDRLKQWEAVNTQFRSTKNKYRNDKNTEQDIVRDAHKNEQIQKRKLICYKCGREGHISYQCTTKKEDVNRINEKQQRNHHKTIDRRTIFINGKRISAIFDTGAIECFIGKGLVDKLKLVSKPLKKKKYTI